MIKANFPRKKDNNTFSKKANIIFDNIGEKYSRRLKNYVKDMRMKFQMFIS